MGLHLSPSALTWDLGLLLSPSALAQDVVEVQGDRLLLDQPLHLAQQLLWQQPHQGLGGESVLGALFVLSLGHVSEHEVGGLVDVVDDRSQVALEVLLGQLLEVGQGRRWDVPLPLQVALALLMRVRRPLFSSMNCTKVLPTLSWSAGMAHLPEESATSAFEASSTAFLAASPACLM